MVGKRTIRSWFVLSFFLFVQFFQIFALHFMSHPYFFYYLFLLYIFCIFVRLEFSSGAIGPHLLFLLCTISWPKINSLIDLFLLFAHDHSTKIYDHLSFILSLCTTIPLNIRVYMNLYILLVHVHSTKHLGPHWFFCLHTTIQPNYMVLFHLFLLQCTSIWPKIRVAIDLFISFAQNHSTKIYDLF